MDECCAPIPVNCIYGCYVWCEIPQRQWGDGKERTPASDNHAFGNCLIENYNKWPINESATAMWRYAEESGAAVVDGRRALGVVGWGVVGLVLVAVLGC
jgi:hypothetical protein